MIDAESDEEAIEKARALSSKLEHKYRNVLGRDVSWTLDEIGDPWELLDELMDGAEVYSRFITVKDRDRLKQPLPSR